MEQVNTPASYSLAKALHYTYFSISYLQDAIRQEALTGNAKDFVNGLINKQKWVLTQVYARMSSEGADLLRKEIEGRDIAAIDSIINLVIALPEHDREAVENFATVLTKNVKKNTDESNHIWQGIPSISCEGRRAHLLRREDMEKPLGCLRRCQ